MLDNLILIGAVVLVLAIIVFVALWWIGIIFFCPYVSLYEIIHCSLCDRDVVICSTCGNNCCNGGYGEIDGEDCPDCPSAYEEDKRLFGGLK